MQLPQEFGQLIVGNKAHVDQPMMIWAKANQVSLCVVQVIAVPMMYVGPFEAADHARASILPVRLRVFMGYRSAPDALPALFRRSDAATMA